mmetsp:Transcript_112317/g.322900  ORF Transcript_112317/g.322900 Transcript_112317/m.322900 type:complete len:91 (-) Transcript_112317:87-359(-)
MNETEFSASPKWSWKHTPKLHPLKKKDRSLLPRAEVLRVLFPAADGDNVGPAASSSPSIRSRSPSALQGRGRAGFMAPNIALLMAESGGQ